MRVLLLVLGMMFVPQFLRAFETQDGKKQAELKSRMQSIFKSISEVLPLHLSQKKFYESAQHQTIVKELGNISSQAQGVSKLFKKSDQEHLILSQSLLNYADSAYKSFKIGAVDQAYYFTEELIETCLSCHTSRKSSKDSHVISFFGGINFEELGPFARAKFLAISRHFDEAMKEYETVLETNPPSLPEILHFDPFLRYLTIGIRVRGENQRIVRLLEKLSKKKQYASSIKKDMRLWVQSLKSLDSQVFSKGSALDQAKVLLDAGKKLMEYPRDQAGAVYFLEASRRLKDYIQKDSVSPDHLAEAYLLTGKSEMVLGRPYLGPEAKHYFEIAITASPGSKTAKEAFDMYQENLIFGYTGSSGIHLPEDEKEKLEFLRKKTLQKN